MAKVVKYDVSLNELELALSERKLSKDELNKINNTALGGIKLRAELEDLTKPDIDATVEVNIKSHGIYIQTDKDMRREGTKDFSFMVRIPFWGGGNVPAEDWQALSKLADKYSSDEFDNPSMRLTTRQGIQFHRVKKELLIQLVHELIALGRTTLNGCGDNTRNPLSCPHKSSLFDGLKLAERLGLYFRHSLDKHFEVFDPSKITGETEGPSFKYGEAGLPRKFKMGIGGYYIDKVTGNEIRCNCADILTNDVGIAPVFENKILTGYQVYAGGGLGQKNGKITFSALAGPLGIFETEDELVNGLDTLVQIQQEIGDRENRHWARFKNVIIKKGLDISGKDIKDIFYDKEQFDAVQLAGLEWLREQLKKRGINIKPPQKIKLGKLEKHHGWSVQDDGRLSYGLWIECGRISDSNSNIKIKTMIDEIVGTVKPVIRLTTNQDLIFVDLSEEDKTEIENILAAYKYTQPSLLRENSLACVGLPTCPLAVSDSERFFTPLFDELDNMGLGAIEGVTIGISGCERHCSRNVRHEISFEGKGYDLYQMKLLFGGQEDNYLAMDIVKDDKKYLRQIPREQVPKVVDALVQNYLENKNEDESNIAEFHKRIGIDGILELFGSNVELSPLLEKTYDVWLV